MTQFIYVPELDLFFTEERILLGKNWQTTKDTLKTQEMAMPTPFQFRAFLKHLKASKEHQELYKDITEVRYPYRAEWLNARFKEREDGMYIISEDALIKGKYEDQEIKLDNCLMQDGYTSRCISLDEYLNSTTPHGLPPANIPNGNLNYWYPGDKSVAGFRSDSDWAGLYCGRDPGGSDPALGVFGARKFSEDSTLEIEIQERLYSIEEITTALGNTGFSGAMHRFLEELRSY